MILRRSGGNRVGEVLLKSRTFLHDVKTQSLSQLSK